MHRLRLPEGVDFMLTVTAFRVLPGVAPPNYLNQLTRVADLPGRRRLRSSSLQLYCKFHHSVGLLWDVARFP